MTPGLMSELDTTRRRVYTLVRAVDARVVGRPAPNGDWSIVEHVRHLTFAEVAHLGRFLAAPLDVRAIGVMDRTRKQFFVADARRRDDLGAVLGAWDDLHRSIGGGLRKSDDPELAYRLGHHIKHLENHIKVIERLLRKFGG